MIVLAVLVFALAVALTWLNNTYDELIGRPRVERRAPSLRSMRAESEGHISSRVGITALERIVIATVYVAVTALIVWLIFAPGRTGDRTSTSCSTRRSARSSHSGSPRFLHQARRPAQPPRGRTAFEHNLGRLDEAAPLVEAAIHRRRGLKAAGDTVLVGFA